MHHLTLRSLTLTVVVSGAVAWALASLTRSSGTSPIRVPWTTPLVGLVLAALVLWLAYPIKQYLAGKRPGIDALRAARTVVFAQAAAYTGAVMLGAFGGYALVMAADWGHEPRRAVAISAVVAAASGLILAIAGWIAERWCRIDPKDESEATAAGGTLAT